METETASGVEMMSEPNPSFNIGGNAENVTIIVGSDNQSANSNEHYHNADRSAEAGASNVLPKTFSVVERRRLRQTLNALPLDLFDDLVYDLAVPAGIIPGVDASQKARCRALLAWSENTEGVGLAQVEELLIPMIAEQTKSAQTYLNFVIEGKIKNKTISELQPIIKLLRQITGDASIDITFVEEGSIRIVLSGSVDGLKKLQALYDSSELETLDIPSVETVQPVDNHTTGDRKARLVQVLQLRGQFLRLEPLIVSARDLNLVLAHASASTSDRARAIARDLARALDRAHDLACTVARYLDRVSHRYRVIARDLASDDPTRDLTRARDLASDLIRDLTRARARNFDFVSAIVIARYLDRALDRARDLDRYRVSDLTDADLRGTNLRNTNLVDVDLTGADLTGADVQGTTFGDNHGLSESVKRDLQKRGAIFQDSPSSDVPSLVHV